MTTDLTDSEIVLGRLASRLLSTLGVVACGLPVLALATLLGGVDPMAVAGGTLVVVGVASLSVSMALAFSLWAGKPHEALSATYAAWLIWTLSYFAWDSLLGRPPDWLLWSNPFGAVFASATSPGDRLAIQACFFAGCLAGTAALASLATWKLRAVTLRRQGKPARARASRGPAPAWLRWIGQGAPRLDDDPILWREWHRKRPSAFTRGIWWTYAVLSLLFTAWSPFGQWVAPGVNALQVTIGLLLACAGAATCLAEERAQGGLDVVLATPIDSRRIVLGKWWGAFRIVPRLAILPGLLILALGVTRGNLEALWLGPLVVGLVLAYGAVVVGLALVIAIYQPRQGRAVALTVAAYLSVTVAYPAFAIPLLRVGPRDSLPLWPSPFFSIIYATLEMDRRFGMMEISPIAGYGFLAIVALVAFVLLRVALGSFDRALGRVVDRSRGVGPGAGGGGRPPRRVGGLIPG